MSWLPEPWALKTWGTAILLALLSIALSGKRPRAT